MNNTTSQKIRIALFTLVALAVLAGAIYFIGSQKSLFGNTFNVYSMFTNVGGLQAGNNVRFAGINIGVVEKIQITGDSSVRVTYRLNSNVRQFLKKDGIASIGSDGLMGDKLVNISPGSTTVKPIADNDMIRSQVPLDFDKIVARLSRVASNADTISGALSSIVGQISRGKGSLGRLLYSDKLAKGLEGTVSSAQKTIASVKQSSEGFTENMTALKSNFLLKGFFKKKQKAAQNRRDSIKALRDSARAARKARRAKKE